MCVLPVCGKHAFFGLGMPFVHCVVKLLCTCFFPVHMHGTNNECMVQQENAWQMLGGSMTSATSWQIMACSVPQVLYDSRTATAHSDICGRTVRPWMPLGAAPHGAVCTALRRSSPAQGGGVGWESQQVAPSSRWIFFME